MRSTFVSALALGMMLSGAALAQSSTGSSTAGSNATPPNSQAGASSTTQQNHLLTVDKLKRDLRNAGFTDVRAVEEAFVVQAKTKDGNPVVMTLGPSGFSAIEAIKPGGSNTTGSTGSTGNTGSSNPPSGSARSGSQRSGFLICRVFAPAAAIS